MVAHRTARILRGHLLPRRHAGHVAVIAAAMLSLALGLPARAAGIIASVTDEPGRPLASAVVTVTPSDRAPIPISA